MDKATQAYTKLGCSQYYKKFRRFESSKLSKLGNSLVIRAETFLCHAVDMPSQCRSRNLHLGMLAPFRQHCSKRNHLVLGIKQHWAGPGRSQRLPRRGTWRRRRTGSPFAASVERHLAGKKEVNWVQIPFNQSSLRWLI